MMVEVERIELRITLDKVVKKSFTWKT